MLTDRVGRLWNVLIVAPPRQVTEVGWKDFESHVDASPPIVQLIFL